jgi:PKD repeat protein
VVDGDSFKITGDEVRLADVSAPEWDEPGGTEASNALKALINEKTVYLDTDQKSGRDPHDRLVAVVYIRKNSTHYMNVNKALLIQGVVGKTDYSNNEFNPSTWTLYVQYSFPPPPPNNSPIAVVNGPYSGVIGVSISFSSAGSSDSDGSIVNHYWDLGDGTTSSSENPFHTFQNEGTFTIVLEVTDDDGETDTATTTCTIQNTSQSEPEPEPEPEFPPLPPLPPILSNLVITPAELESGDEVTIILDIENSDSQFFTYIVTMQIGELTLLVDVELGAYESKTISRTITPDMVGVFKVTVDGLAGRFTVKAPPKPAEFEFSNLRIFYPGVIPPEVEKGQTVTVTISIEAENVGELEGDRTVELKVNGEVVDSKEVTLEDGASETVLFELTRGEGTYEVEVEGVTDSFTLNPKPSFWDKIPGFPYESILLGLVTVILVLWLSSSRKMTE